MHQPLSHTLIKHVIVARVFAEVWEIVKFRRRGLLQYLVLRGGSSEVGIILVICLNLVEGQSYYIVNLFHGQFTAILYCQDHGCLLPGF